RDAPAARAQAPAGSPDDRTRDRSPRVAVDDPDGNELRPDEGRRPGHRTQDGRGRGALGRAATRRDCRQRDPERQLATHPAKVPSAAAVAVEASSLQMRTRLLITVAAVAVLAGIGAGALSAYDSSRANRLA